MIRQQIDLRDARSSHFHGPIARAKAAAYTLGIGVLIYLATFAVPVGWATYLATVLPLLVILITVVARVNDLGVDMSSARWNVRRVGLILTGAFAFMKLLAPFPDRAGIVHWPAWAEVLGIWGFALMLLTTPHQPPWSRYVSGKFEPAPDHPHRRATDDFESNP